VDSFGAILCNGIGSDRRRSRKVRFHQRHVSNL